MPALGNVLDSSQVSIAELSLDVKAHRDNPDADADDFKKLRWSVSLRAAVSFGSPSSSPVPSGLPLVGHVQA